MSVAATDIFTLVVRIIVAISVIFVFVEIVYSFSVVVNTNEIDKVVVEISEDMMSSSYDVDGKTLTASRAVFDYTALKTLERKNKYIEPVRNCKFGAYYEFHDLNKNEKIASFGYFPYSKPPEGLSFGKEKKAFYVGISIENPDKSSYIVPGRMDITIYDDFVTRLTCEIEKAWVNNHMVEYKPTTYFTLQRDDENIKSGFIYRWIGEIKTMDYFELSIAKMDDAKSSGREVVLQFIPMEKTDYDSKGCSKDSTPSPGDERIVCIESVIR